MVEYLNEMLTRYFTILTMKGYYNYNEVYKMLYVISLYDIINDFEEYITAEDIALFNSRLACIIGTDCLFPVPVCKKQEEPCEPTDGELKECTADGLHTWDYDKCECVECENIKELKDCIGTISNCTCVCTKAQVKQCKDLGGTLDENCNCILKPIPKCDKCEIYNPYSGNCETLGCNCKNEAEYQKCMERHYVSGEDVHWDSSICACTRCSSADRQKCWDNQGSWSEETCTCKIKDTIKEESK